MKCKVRITNRKSIKLIDNCYKKVTKINYLLYDRKVNQNVKSSKSLKTRPEKMSNCHLKKQNQEIQNEEFFFTPYMQPCMICNCNALVEGGSINSGMV